MSEKIQSEKISLLEKIKNTFGEFPLYGSFGLIAINILVFIIMLFDGVSFFDPSSEDLLKWGANFGPLTLKGEGWRLFTCEFVHIGFAHLLTNMISLLYIGVILEPLIGTIRFITVYLLATIAAALVSLWWNSFAIGAGASGAVLGMYGMLLMFSVVGKKMFAKGELTGFFLWAAIVIGFNLISGLKSGIDNAAHIGGIIFGLFAAVIFYPSYRKKENFSFTILNDVFLVVISLALFSFAYSVIPKGIAQYDDKMAQFSQNEDVALAIYTEYDNDTLIHEHAEHYIARFQNEGVNVWQKNIALLESLKGLPVHFNQRVKMLIQYSFLRRQSCELIIKNLQQPSDSLQNEIEDTYHYINLLLSDIKSFDRQGEYRDIEVTDTMLLGPGIHVNDIDVSDEK